MNLSGKVLIFGGLALAALGMLYGLSYAVFTEHQTLDEMGGSLAHGFGYVATRHLDDAQAAITKYGETKYDYVRQVDAHSHWVGLAMLMIALGVAFDRVAFAESARRWLAWSLVAGSTMFPLGVMLQTMHHGSAVATTLAVVGSVLITIALAAVAVGFGRQSA